MAKLFIYGDSFAAYSDFRKSENYVSWVTLLANRLQVTDILNRAMSGSSIEFSMRNFISDVLNNLIKKEDIIIFIISSQGRIHTVYQNECPVTASQFLRVNTFENDYLDIPKDRLSYFKNNKIFIDWYLKNRDEYLININTAAYIHMLSNFAKNNLSNTLILLNLYDIKNPINLDFSTNFIYPKVSLMKISTNEFAKGIKWDDWVKVTKQDVRYNHLSIPNINIFANLLFEMIGSKDPSIFTYNKFKRNFLDKVIKSSSDYENYVNNNILHNSPSMTLKLNKITNKEP